MQVGRNTLVDKIHRALVGDSRGVYDVIRREIIDEHGYEAFRDMQQEAFNEICRVDPNWRPQ